jgi:hypothetical protein
MQAKVNTVEFGFYRGVCKEYGTFKHNAVYSGRIYRRFEQLLPPSPRHEPHKKPGTKGGGESKAIPVTGREGL